MVTMKDIAKLAGVSRGTVDRVINNRGSVNPDTERIVREIIKTVNYSPNAAGKNLAVRKKKLKFGFVIFGALSADDFFSDVVLGIKKRAADLADLGVTVEIRGTHIHIPEQQVKLIDELVELGINGLAIAPINHPLVADRLRELSRSGIPVVTSNSDIPDCGRLAYVGSNFYKCGETAASLMNLITGGAANVGIISGAPNILCNSERVAGFSEYAGKYFPNLNIVDVGVNSDYNDISYTGTLEMLRTKPQIEALFISSAGVSGVCRAVRELDLDGKISIVCFDATDAINKLVRDGTVTATIAQEPVKQGTKPLNILFDYLCMGTIPENEFNFTEIEIKIKENL